MHILTQIGSMSYVWYDFLLLFNYNL